MVEGESRNPEDICALVQIVATKAVGKRASLHVTNPGLVYIGRDLVAGGGLGKSGGVDRQPRCLLIALIAVKDAERDIHVEASSVLRPSAFVLAFNCRVGRAV